MRSQPSGRVCDVSLSQHLPRDEEPRMRRALCSALAVGVAATAGAVGFGISEGASGVPPAPFAGGSLVVYRVGSGATLSGAAAPVFLDYYKADGSADHTLSVPTATSGIQHRLTAAGY